MTGPLKIGSLFSGYGGLDIGVKAVLDAETAWFAEFDAAPSKILAHHWPDVPNHGDITKIGWSQVEPVDILTGGFPCQDVSLAGARRGLRDGTRSGLWSYFAEAIDALRPSLVVIENVRGLLSASAGDTEEFTDEEVSDLESGQGNVGGLGRNDRPVLRALGVVLGNLAELGYDTQWCGLRAADAGAPHGRYRVFILAHPAGKPWRVGNGNDLHARRGAVEREQDAGTSSDAHPANLGHERAGAARGWRDGLEDSGYVAAHSGRIGGHEGDDVAGLEGEGADRSSVANEHSARSGGTEWGPYQPAVERWEAVTGRPAPAATKGDGRDGSHRLSAEFVEFMMGLDMGHVTNPAIGLTRNDQLKACGNGVVPQQAALALRVLMGRAA